MKTEHVGPWPKHRFISLIIAAFAVTVAVLAIQLGVGTFQNPGAGMWPLLVSSFTGICALVLLFTERDASDYEPLTRRSVVVVVGFLLMAGYIVGFTYIGMTITSLLFSFIWLRFLAHESWLSTWVGTLGFTIAFVGLFVIVLKIPIPYDPVVALITTGRL